MSVQMKEAIYKEIVKNKFMGAAARTINRVADSLSCNRFVPNNLCGTPTEAKPENIIEIFSNYSSLPLEDFKDIVGIKGCSSRQEGFLGLNSSLNNYCAMIVYLKCLYLKLMEGNEVICMDYEDDDECISSSFLFIEDGVLYSMCFEFMENVKDCNFINMTIAAFSTHHSEAAEEYSKELRRYQAIAESFYIENYMAL